MSYHLKTYAPTQFGSDSLEALYVQEDPKTQSAVEMEIVSQGQSASKLGQSANVFLRILSLLTESSSSTKERPIRLTYLFSTMALTLSGVALLQEDQAAMLMDKIAKQLIVVMTAMEGADHHRDSSSQLHRQSLLLPNNLSTFMTLKSLTESIWESQWGLQTLQRV